MSDVSTRESKRERPSSRRPASSCLNPVASCLAPEPENECPFSECCAAAISRTAEVRNGPSVYTSGSRVVAIDGGQPGCANFGRSVIWLRMFVSSPSRPLSVSHPQASKSRKQFWISMFPDVSRVHMILGSKSALKAGRIRSAGLLLTFCNA